MNKEYELNQLGRILGDPMQQSGLYLIDTYLSDDEIEKYIRGLGKFNYVKGRLVNTSEGNPLELLIVGLSYSCNDNEINNLRYHFLISDGKKRDTIFYSLLIQTLRSLCICRKSIFHIHGNIDLTSLKIEDIEKFESALISIDETILIISKQQNEIKHTHNIKIESLKTKFMENRLDMVHISYKHNKSYENVIDSIEKGLKKNGIEYSIDRYDIMYLDNIDKYEIEIGLSNIVIMIIIPEYFKSLDCMFEMTQIFKNGNIRNRVKPLVDMGNIQRNGNGLTEIKNYWQEEKIKKLERVKGESGGSKYLLMEIKRIDDIIKTLDDLWTFICRNSTGNFEKLIENDAALLMEEIKNSKPREDADIDGKFIPSKDTKPIETRKINQHGEKSLYIENNSGNIIIN